jgi:hypothetical protein
LTYFLAPWLESHYDIFEEVRVKLNLKLGESGANL